MAGRAIPKLQAIKDKYNISAADLVQLDNNDPVSLDAAISQAKVVLTLAGPYAMYGSKVVESCVRHGTHYCDLTGEAPWVRQMIDAHHADAEKNSVKIVNCCGFDSLPSDLGCQMMINAMKEKGLEPQEVRYCLTAVEGGISGGTILSCLNMIETSTSLELAASANPWLLAPRDATTGKLVAPEASVCAKGRDTWTFSYDKVLKRWCMPFVMQAVNTRVVNRSNALTGFSWGKNLVYREMMQAPNMFVSIMTSSMYPVIGALMYFPPTRWFLKSFVLPAPGQGPTEQQREKGFFRVKYWGIGKDLTTGEEVIMRGGLNHMDGDPGYKGTAKMITEAAMCLAFDSDKTPKTYGVITPSYAMGTVLTERLQAKGVEFFMEK